MTTMRALILWLPMVAFPAFAAQPLVHEETWDDVSIAVRSANSGSINSAAIFVRTTGRILLDTEVMADGQVTGVELADLDANGYPELYVYVTSVGSGSYGSLMAFASNRNVSMTPIHLVALPPESPALAGYLGHDRFRVADQVLERSFPVYLAGDTNANPTGGSRRLRYELVQGEASWLLRLRP